MYSKYQDYEIHLVFEPMNSMCTITNYSCLKNFNLFIIAEWQTFSELYVTELKYPCLTSYN